MNAARDRGYTLVELMVVLVVIGIMLGLVSLSIVPDPKARLQRDAERLEALFALAAEEAQLTSRPITWRADEKGYAFYRQERNEWIPFDTDPQFRARTWDTSPVRITLDTGDAPRWGLRTDNGLGAIDDGSTSIAFPRDGLQAAFELKLETDGRAVLLKGDGGGRYTVEPGA